MSYTLLAFATYFSVLLGIGLYSRRSQATAADFIVGGRSLNFWVTALSAHASDMSSWLFIGLPMAVFLGGLGKSWIAMGLLIGMYLNWQLVAPRLRKETERYNCYTLSDFFEARFQDESGLLRLISAALILIFMVGYLASGFIGIGLLFESTFNFSYTLGILFASGVVLLYVTTGGYVAVAWTDFFQALFLLGAILVVPLLAYQASEAIDWQTGALLPTTGSFLEAAAWGLGYFGMPHVLTKFMGIRDPNEMHKAKRVGIAWQTITLIAAIMVGVVATGYFGEESINPQLIFVEMVSRLFHPYFGGLILCGILAATISTMDSQLLVASGVLAEDFYRRWRPNATDGELLTATRLSVVLLIAFGVAVSIFYRELPIFTIVEFCWVGLGCGFGPLVLWSLLQPQLQRPAALALLGTGAIIAVGWPLLGIQVPSIVVAHFVAPLVVLASKKLN